MGGLEDQRDDHYQTLSGIETRSPNCNKPKTPRDDHYQTCLTDKTKKLENG